MEEEIRKALESIRPYLQADDGDVQLVEVSDDGTNFSTEETTISYEPVLKAYQILSMGKYEDDEDVIYYSLNLAYEIKWMSKEELEEKNKILAQREKEKQEIRKGKAVEEAKPDGGASTTSLSIQNGLVSHQNIC